MAPRKFTRQEIESRGSETNVVIIIDNVVYDVSDFLEDHPGGVEVLRDNAGKDVSECFHEVGHSEVASDWQKHLVLGEVVDEDRRAVVLPPPPQDPEPPSAMEQIFYSWILPMVLSLLIYSLYSYFY